MRAVALLLVPAVWTACSESPGDGSLFRDITREAGVEALPDRARSGDYFMPDSMAAGGAWLDHDGDGDLDLYLVAGDASGESGANRLLRQEADGRFTDVTAEAGGGDPGYGMGVTAGDADGDGDVDLYVTNAGRDTFYRNDGGRFVDATAQAGFTKELWSASAGFVDYDGDGDLDLFVTHYLDFDPGMRVTDSGGRPEYPGPGCCAGVDDALFRNEGGGRFVDVSVEAGIAGSPGKGLGVAFLDADRNGAVDIFVANDGEANRLWLQESPGRFTDRAVALGVAFNVYGAAEASMGVALGDVNGDARADLFLTHLNQETNTLYLSEEDGGFRDATIGSGLGAVSVDRTGFGAEFVDFDLDGDLDLLAVNGRVLRGPLRPGARAGGHWAPYAEENQLWIQDGTGGFGEDRVLCGTLCGEIAVSRGLAIGDLDGDGDSDVLITDAAGQARLYRNEQATGHHWLGLSPLGTRGGVPTPGTSICIRAGERRQCASVPSGRSYLSAHDLRVRFGLGEVAAVDEVRVTWTDGVAERFGPLETDRYHVVVRGEGTP